MNMIFIYGPPAVGKLTVAEELAKITGYKLFHNHLTQDLAREIYPEFGPQRFALADDFRDRRLEDDKGWVRVRDEGGKITLSYKQTGDRTLHGTKEVSVNVNDFDNACLFLESIGLESKSFQETKRESWKYGDIEIELDTWPWIPGFVEIEAGSENELRETAAKLNLDFGKALHGSVELAYQALYDVTEDEINNWPEICFGDVPDWLIAKKI